MFLIIEVLVIDLIRSQILLHSSSDLNIHLHCFFQFTHFLYQ